VRSTSILLAVPAVLAVLPLALPRCERGRDGGGDAVHAAPAPFVAPAGSAAVPAGEPLQPRIDAAADGAVLALAPGRYRGPITVTRPLTIVGPRDAVIAGSGEGTTVFLHGDRIALQGCTVEGSGTRFDLLDSAVRVEGQDVRVEDVEVRGALFGILVQLSRRAVVRGNRVLGTGQPAMGLRGDGIRLWETTDSVVAHNEVRDCRDVVVWYSSKNRIEGNRVSGCRYGTHFMYSHDNDVADNRYVDDVVGVFVMYSHDVRLRRNLLARAGGAAGIGIGLKESGNLVVEENWLVQNTTGIYLDTSPLDLAHENRFRGNVIRLCDTAVAFHASSSRNDFTQNVFADNGAIVTVGGGGDVLQCAFRGNFYDTYRGYDLDGDGFGDVPFEFRRLSTQLEARHPDLALLHGAPAMQMVDLVGEVLPLFAPKQLLRDERPLVREGAASWTPEVDDAR
jgi:nitrous oxidase accessory protein